MSAAQFAVVRRVRFPGRCRDVRIVHVHVHDIREEYLVAFEMFLGDLWISYKFRKRRKVSEEVGTCSWCHAARFAAHVRGVAVWKEPWDIQFTGKRFSFCSFCSAGSVSWPTIWHVIFHLYCKCLDIRTSVNVVFPAVTDCNKYRLLLDKTHLHETFQTVVWQQTTRNAAFYYRLQSPCVTHIRK